THTHTHFVSSLSPFLPSGTKTDRHTHTHTHSMSLYWLSLLFAPLTSISLLSFSLSLSSFPLLVSLLSLSPSSLSLSVSPLFPLTLFPLSFGLSLNPYPLPP